MNVFAAVHLQKKMSGECSKDTALLRIGVYDLQITHILKTEKFPAYQPSSDAFQLPNHTSSLTGFISGLPHKMAWEST